MLADMNDIVSMHDAIPEDLTPETARTVHYGNTGTARRRDLKQCRCSV